MARTLDAPDRWWSKDTVAVVTGSNKGLGYEIVRELARNGMTVVLTARDTPRGLAAVETALAAEPELKGFIHFHQLDITMGQSVAECAAWLQKSFGGLDILINNAGIHKEMASNYFGTKRVTEGLLPLFRASPHGARILMISSQLGRVEVFRSNESLRLKVEEAVEAMDKNMVDSLASKYSEDVKAGRANAEEIAVGNPSKLFLNTYTRVLAREFSARPDDHAILANAMCPGLVRTDLGNGFVASLSPAVQRRILDVTIYKGRSAEEAFQTAEEAAKGPVWLTLLPRDETPQGKFFFQKQESTF